MRCSAKPLAAGTDGKIPRAPYLKAPLARAAVILLEPIMKTLSIPLLLVLLSACAAIRPPLTTLERETVSYRCGDGVEMAVVYAGRATGLQGTADLIWDAKGYRLKQVVSGSGSSYTDGTLTLVTKGDEAFVEKSGETVLKDCVAKS